MNALMLYWLVAMLLGYRVALFVRFWRLPYSLAKDRFLGLPVQASAAQPLLLRYRILISIIYLTDLCCALGAFVWGGVFGLVIEQAVAAIVVRFYHSFVGIHVIRKAKWLAAQDSWKPVRQVAFMLETRRLRDYISVAFELSLPVLTLASFGMLAYQLRHATEEDSLPSLAPICAFAALAIYLQLGGLLVKHSLVKWRWRIPGERVEEYLSFRGAVLRYWLWVCDYFRCVVTVALLALVFFPYFHASGAGQKTVMIGNMLAAATLILIGTLGYERQQRRMMSLWKAMQPLEDFTSPPEAIDIREFFLGGLCYFNAENPALFVPGPLVYAVNLGNKRSYLYAAYVVLMIPLGIWCASSQRARGAGNESLQPPAQVSKVATKQPSSLQPEALRDLAAGVRQLIDDDEAVGAEVLILHHRKVVLHEAFGWADLDRRTPLTPNTIVCIRSMTKPLVGTAIQMLIDEGKLSLADAASKYLPAFANDKSRSITIEQLLTHTAGFPLTHINKALSAYSGQRAVADQAGQAGPTSPAGTFRYSDCDTETLAAIVSEVAGEPVDAFIRRRILDPLEMKDTYCVLGNNVPPRSRVSSNHAGSPGMWHKYWDHEEKPFFPFFLGAASAYSTPSDYARFLSLWLDRGQVGGRRLLSEATIDRALRPAQPMLSPGSNAPFPTGLKPLRPHYGQHWMIYVATNPGAHGALPVFGHDGSDGTMALVFPEQELMAFYFTQSRGGLSIFQFEEMLAPLVGLPVPPQHTRLSVDQLQPYLGAYQEAGTGKRVWVTLQGKRLRLEISGGGALLPQWPDAKGRWSFGESQPGVAVSFDKSSVGDVTEVRLWQNDKELAHYTRLPLAKDLPSVDQVMAFRRLKQGGDMVDALRSLEIKGKLRVGQTDLDTTIVAAGSDRIVRRVSLPAGTEMAVADGGRVRKQSPGQPVEDLNGLRREESLRISPLVRLGDWRQTSAAVRLAGTDRLGDEPVWIVRLECEFSPPLTRYVSTKTGLLLKEEAWITAKGVGTVPFTVLFEDYREVAGVQLPFRLKSESRLSGKQVMQFTEANANVIIRKETFALPKD